ncbi:DUF7373 family lipoprotein [Tsukamurella spumae]|uniref:DUF7373 domain-containing protein n=1 Tax=Tsukamurella spumae TaxID=44753 RepID=A0A846X533_9ACTN|nr:hypothetical protein [Tsukamurella spumae]NKY19626.1 hypothetical protein [Tsukamurella spumae]
MKASAAADWWQQEAYRLADSVVAPWDVDAAIARKADGETPAPVLGAYLITNSGVPGPHLLPTSKSSVFQGIPIQTGFVSAASDPSGVVLRIGAIRFADATTASRALDALTATPAVPSGAPTGTRVLTEGTLDGKHWLTLGTTRANLLLVSSTSSPSPGRTTDSLVTKALSMQADKIGNYQQSSMDSVTNTPNVPMDTDDKIMEYTVRAGAGTPQPLAGTSASVGYLDGYMTPRTLAMTTVGVKSEIETQAAKYGWELYASRSGVSTTRYRDVDSARRYFSDRFGEGKGVVPGIPAENARCGKVASGGYSCTAWAGGRYTSSAASNTLTKAQQIISAQYLLLQQRPS